VSRWSRSVWWLAIAGLAVVEGFSLFGCDRGQATAPEQPDQPDQPDQGAVVVVESPGVAPDPASDPAGLEDETIPGRTEIVATQVDCQQDSDCVKATCCHATTCVAASAKPDCASVSCTADCRAGSMDCNGGCLCQAGKCAAKLWFAPGE
jgi:hypothetical protein